MNKKIRMLILFVGLMLILGCEVQLVLDDGQTEKALDVMGNLDVQNDSSANDLREEVKETSGLGSSAQKAIVDTAINKDGAVNASQKEEPEILPKAEEEEIISEEEQKALDERRMQNFEDLLISQGLSEEDIQQALANYNLNAETTEPVAEESDGE